MMNRNKINIAQVVLAALLLSSHMSVWGLTDSQREIGMQLLAVNDNRFCGNSPGLDVTPVMIRNGIDARVAGEIFAGIVEECLQVSLPRPAETNRLCSRSLLWLGRLKVSESVPLARRAFMDPSGKFNFDAMSVYFSCETNVQAIADFTAVVWTNTLGDASTKRLDYAISMKDWLRGNRDLTGMQKSVLYDRFVACAQAESEAYVALRLDPILLLLNHDYESSEARTNLVIRFKDNTSALMDPLYFRRLADSMGIQ